MIAMCPCQVILAGKIRQACARAEAGTVVVAVLGMAHEDGVARLLQEGRRGGGAGVETEGTAEEGGEHEKDRRGPNGAMKS